MRPHPHGRFGNPKRRLASPLRESRRRRFPPTRRNLFGGPVLQSRLAPCYAAGCVVEGRWRQQVWWLPHSYSSRTWSICRGSCRGVCFVVGVLGDGELPQRRLETGLGLSFR